MGINLGRDSQRGPGTGELLLTADNAQISFLPKEILLKNLFLFTAQPEHTLAVPYLRGNPEPPGLHSKFQRHRQEDHCVPTNYLVEFCLPVTSKQDSWARHLTTPMILTRKLSPGRLQNTHEVMYSSLVPEGMLLTTTSAGTSTPE